MDKHRHYVDKLAGIAHRAISRHQYEKAMTAVDAAAYLSYVRNATYHNQTLEDLVCRIAQGVFPTKPSYSHPNRQRILFYDGFGLDTRGLALIYLHALVDLGYEILYVTDEASADSQPQITQVLEQGKATVARIPFHKGYTARIQALHQLLQTYQPAQGFLYTLPNDVAGLVVFHSYAGVMERFCINLTDHAFWLGTCGLDTSIEFRNYGASISHHYRGLPWEQIRILPFYPWFRRDIPFQGLPEGTQGKKILFTGGSLYKTLDKENTFYRMVETILEENPDTVFLYAGSGDDTSLRALAERRPGQVVHIAERTDLFALMEHIDLYLCTYPIVGGLMTQYAAIAGKVPLILTTKKWTDTSDMLMGQDKLGVEFYDPADLVAACSRLLQNPDLRRELEAAVSGSVPTPQVFQETLGQIITHQMPPPEAMGTPDDQAFLAGYAEQFQPRAIVDAIIQKKKLCLLPHFPELLLQKFTQ